MNIKKITSNNTIYKSNSLMSSLYDLSLQEQRIVLLLISMVNPREDQDFRFYEMPVEMFVKVIGVEGKAYHKELDLITDKLMKRSFRIDDPDGGWLKINWLSACQYKKGEGIILLEISQHLKPYLLDLKSHYTSYRLRNILPLRSGYSIRIYELLKQYEAIGERYLAVAEMRQMMEIKDTEYKNYNDFKKKVILKAQKELLEKTDICFDFKEKKRARRVIGLFFFIKRNVLEENKAINMITADDSSIPEKEALESIQDVELYQRLLKLGFTPAQAKIYLVKYDSNQLLANVEYVEFQIQRNNKIENLPAYTTSIIKRDVRLQSTLFDATTVEQQQPAIDLKEGMEIEIAGETYVYADDCVSMGRRGIIPKGQIKQMIRDGQAKIFY